jgi:hypothetical protein
MKKQQINLVLICLRAHLSSFSFTVKATITSKCTAEITVSGYQGSTAATTFVTK